MLFLRLLLSPCVSSMLVPYAHAEGNSPPVADAGLGVFAYVGDKVILNGQASSDPDGQAITFAWTQVSGPVVALADATTSDPSFLVTEPGTVRFQLIVTDGSLASAPDSVAVIIPDREAEPLGSGGCATAPGSLTGGAWLGLALAGLATSRRFRR